MNKISLIGRVANRPYCNACKTGKFVSFILCVPGAPGQEILYIKCYCTNDVCDKFMVADIDRGDQIGVVGSLQNRGTTTAEGKKEYFYTVFAQEITVLENKKRRVVIYQNEK